MIKINPHLKKQLQEQPDELFDLIVRTDGAAEPYVAWCEANNLQVKRQYRLSPGLAMCGRGADALKLLDMDWVISVEPDAPVQTM